MPSSRSQWTGFALSVLFVLVLYWPAVFGHGSFFQRDVWLYWVPYVEWAARTLATGHLPQWNPYIGFGAPYLADPSSQFFYPPSLLNWILQPRVAYTVLVVGHSIFGAAGAMSLLRRLRSTPSALVGTMVFVGAGPIVSSANLWHHFVSAMYMPWVIDAFLRLRRGKGSSARLGLLTGLQALAGSAELCVMTGLCMIYLWPLSRRRAPGLFAKVAGSFVLCCLLASVQWLPALKLAASANRASLNSQARLHWSVTPGSLIDFVLPVNGAADAVSGEPDFIEQRLRFIPWMYLGASTLPLLLLGMRRSPRGAAFLALVVVLSLGRHTPVGAWIQMLPVVSTFRFPSKLLWLVSGCWATLAAVGFKEVARRTPRIHLPGLAIGLIVASLGLLSRDPSATIDRGDWRKIHEGLPWAPLALGSLIMALSLGRRGTQIAVLVVAADLAGAGQSFNAYSNSDMWLMRPSIVDELRRLNARRVFVLQQSRSASMSLKTPASWSDEEAYDFGQGQFLLPPQSMRWSIRGSFDGDFTGLASPDYAAMCSWAGGGDLLRPNLLRLGGVTHAIRFAGNHVPELPVVATVRTFHAQPALIMSVPDPLPPAYVVSRIQTVLSSDDALRAMESAEFDPRNTIIRVEGTRMVAPAPGPEIEPRARVQLEEPSEMRSVVHAQLAAPGTLVLLNAFSEGWRARVDGASAPLKRANLIFQSVDLPAGNHVVEVDYQTPGLALGAALSALGWAFVIWQATARIRRRGIAD
ncbi:MAG: YfhO family protein [Vicinamibacteria bacterium]